MRSVISGQFCGVVAMGLFLGLSIPGVSQEIPVAPPAMPSVPQGQSKQQGTQPGSTQPNDERRQPGTQSLSGPGQPVNSSSYKIGPADILNIRVWNEGEFSGPVAVHEDGMITLPLIGDLKAGGSTPTQVEDLITKALSKYVVKPLVTVTVQEVGSKKYYMDGQIARAGEYPLVVPTTVLDALSKAGGTQAFANNKKIYILRGTKRILFNYKDVLRGKHMDQNIELQPGDHVVVP